MKKYLAPFICFLIISTIHLDAQMKTGASNNSNKIPATELNGYKKRNFFIAPIPEPKKVLMHYMGWFSAGNAGRHWSDGQPRIPIIGCYDSRSWATQMYHILLSWSCGIDGLVINIKDDFDYQSLKMLAPTLKRITDINNTDFKYEFSISYDDQGMDNIETAKSKFIRDSGFMNKPTYLKYDGTPVIFIFNYKNPNPYLSATDYKTALETVFLTNRPKVVWNEIEAPEIANSYYPWVKGEPWVLDGSNWGKTF
jgi:hypothetical protein